MPIPYLGDIIGPRQTELVRLSLVSTRSFSPTRSANDTVGIRLVIENPHISNTDALMFTDFFIF